MTYLSVEPVSVYLLFHDLICVRLYGILNLPIQSSVQQNVRVLSFFNVADSLRESREKSRVDDRRGQDGVTIDLVDTFKFLV